MEFNGLVPTSTFISQPLSTGSDQLQISIFKIIKIILEQVSHPHHAHL